MGTSRGFSWLLWVASVVAVGVMGCGEDEAAAGVCEASPFVGRHLWNVGNCEAGTLVPVSSATCGATLCGGNARDLTECTGDNLFEISVGGTTITGEATFEPFVLTRDLVCTRDSPNDISGCEAMRCLIDHDPDFYLQRFTQRPRGEQVSGDGMWFAMDEAWPGDPEQCRSALEADERFQRLNAECPF